MAGITLGDFWDKSAERKGSGLYAEDKAPKPAVATLEKLFGEEWRTEYTHSLDPVRVHPYPYPKPKSNPNPDH